MKGCTPSLVDLMLTNKKQLCFNIQNLPKGISDCHNLISVTIKGKVNIQKCQTITFRSYRKFDIDLFNTDIARIKLPEIESITTSDQVHGSYMQYENEFSKILDNHAPIKTRSSVRNPLTCMNSDIASTCSTPNILRSETPKHGENLGNREI